MDKFLIRGGRKLEGSVEVSSAKNAYLPILAGSILAENEIILHKCPLYTDVINMGKILENLGSKVKYQENSLIIDSRFLNKNEIPHELSSVIRSSIFSLGSILGRFKSAKVAYPGGCEIGTRPIDLHIKGLEALNVKIIDKHGYLYCDGSNMKGGIVHLDFPSVGATENIMLAAVLTKGKTEIVNAAKEPEIVDLQNFLNLMGAKISGAGTSIVTIEGVKKLDKKIEFTPIPDRIIAGTYLIAGVMAGCNMEIKNADSNHIQSLISKLRNSSCKIKVENDTIHIVSEKRARAIQKIETSPYPGFPTDLQPQIMALQTVSKGTSIIVENLFETRFKQVPELIKMGARIVVKDRSAIIRGVNKLYGAEVSSTDLRCGIALVLAGLTADGYTTISNVHHIDRGYMNVEEEFRKLGVDIKRI